jgi:two-component system NtrC family response regulator
VPAMDDDATVRKTLSGILRKKGYVVETARTGRQAINTPKRQSFSVALVDVRLPEVDGTTLLDKLKETEPRMTKIIITGYPSSWIAPSRL